MHTKNQFCPGTELFPSNAETMADTFSNLTGKTQQ